MFNLIRNWFRQRRVNKARDLWVEALRSGEFKQAEGVLCKLDADGHKSYCCLGVACEVYDKHVKPLTRETCPSVGDDHITYDGALTALPRVVAEWLGITQGGELKQTVGESRSLIGCNDTARMSFKQIAKVIEGGNLKEHNSAEDNSPMV